MRAKDYFLGFITGIVLMYLFASFIGFFQLSTVKNKPLRINKLTGKVDVWDGSRWQQMTPDLLRK